MYPSCWKNPAIGYIVFNKRGKCTFWNHHLHRRNFDPNDFVFDIKDNKLISCYESKCGGYYHHLVSESAQLPRGIIDFYIN